MFTGAIRPMLGGFLADSVTCSVGLMFSLLGGRLAAPLLGFCPAPMERRTLILIFSPGLVNVKSDVFPYGLAPSAAQAERGTAP
jgi:hypothetical protein